MEKSTKCVVFLLFNFLNFLGRSEAQLAPALYVFGDSTVDVGNNNALKTFSKSNYSPYGVDFPHGISTGRPTNGYNMADLIAVSLGLQSPPAIKLVDNITNYTQGFNYASSSAGILPESGFKGSLSLVDQVGLFKKTVMEYLPLDFPNYSDLNKHLSKSIFLIVIGVNDYALNFLKKMSSGQPFDEEAAANLLLEIFGNNLQELYNLGARKFVVFNIEALGCLPITVNQYKPKDSKCVDIINSMVLKFNEKLSPKLQGLTSSLKGSVFVIGKNYEHILNLVEQPQNYGLEDARNPCCVVTRFGTCDEKISVPCEDRKSRAFFDAYHPTESVYKIIAQSCFDGFGVCVPYNVRQLALL